MSNVPDKNNAPKVADIGLTRRQVHEARQVRYAEKREPGIVNRTLDAKLKAGEEPTRADVKRAVRDSISPEPERRDGSRAANATKAAPGKTLTVSEATKALIGALGREYPERADVEHQLSRLYTRCIAKMFPGQLMRRPQEMVLREQNDRLHDEVERLRDEVERLRDEVERLRASRAPSAADQEYPELPRCLRRVS